LIEIGHLFHGKHRLRTCAPLFQVLFTFHGLRNTPQPINGFIGWSWFFVRREDFPDILSRPLGRTRSGFHEGQGHGFEFRFATAIGGRVGCFNGSANPARSWFKRFDLSLILASVADYLFIFGPIFLLDLFSSCWACAASCVLVKAMH
jgi:hypothetical protein